MPHTPEPWTVIHGAVTAHNGKTICTVPDNTPEDRDNAQLIAAAPKMLEAIHEIAEACMTRLRKGKDTGDLTTLRLCRTAIIAAQGREHASARALNNYHLTWLRMHTSEELSE